jgi:hypothetical protein
MSEAGRVHRSCISAFGAVDVVFMFIRSSRSHVTQVVGS